MSPETEKAHDAVVIGPASREQSISIQTILKITLPVILSMFSLNLMVFVDRAFVSMYDLGQFAAVVPAGNVGTAISSIFIGIIGFVSTLIAQYYGAGKYPKCASSMWQGVYLSIFFSAVLLLVSPLAVNIFNWMGHTGELLVYEKQFFYLIMVSSCVQLFITAFSGLFRGVASTTVIMMVGILSNIFNVLLDWLLIFGKLGFPELGGIWGSGVAIIGSSVLAVIVYVILLGRRGVQAKYEISAQMKWDGALLRKLLHFGFPAGIQAFLGTGYFSLLLLIIGKTGEFPLSASNIAFTIEGVSIFPIWGLGAAIAIIAGQEKGAGRLDNVRRAAKLGLGIGLVFNVLIILIFNLFPQALISIFGGGKDQETFLKLMAVTVPLVRLTSLWIVFDTMQIIIGNVLRAVGDTMFMMVIYIVVPILFYIVIPYLFSVVWGLSLIWIWIALVVYSMVMLLLVSVRFLGGKWKRIEVI